VAGQDLHRHAEAFQRGFTEGDLRFYFRPSDDMFAGASRLFLIGSSSIGQSLILFRRQR
jgi:hypothetical protein